MDTVTCWIYILFQILVRECYCQEAYSAIHSSLSGGGMIMGGSCVGELRWFFPGLESKVGERPGAKSSLKSAGIEKPQMNVNLCILTFVI